MAYAVPPFELVHQLSTPATTIIVMLALALLFHRDIIRIFKLRTMSKH